MTTHKKDFRPMTTKKDNEEPAFQKSSLDPCKQAVMVQTDIILRDYFAAKAMQGMVTSSASFQAASENCKAMGITVERLLASSSYRMADAMLEARK